MRMPNVMLSRGAVYLRRPQSFYRLKDGARYERNWFFQDGQVERIDGLTG